MQDPLLVILFLFLDSVAQFLLPLIHFPNLFLFFELLISPLQVLDKLIKIISRRFTLKLSLLHFAHSAFLSSCVQLLPAAHA
jgi:hypothetical protein